MSVRERFFFGSIFFLGGIDVTVPLWLRLASIAGLLWILARDAWGADGVARDREEGADA